jgi:DNA-binding NtrC family response regulator
MRKITLLVLDDDRDVVDIYREILEQEGYEVTTATSGDEARRATRARFYDLLVLDERIPGISGTAFLAECRARFPGIGAIFVTAHASVEWAIRAVRAGASDLLLKPVTREMLVAAVQRALAESQLTREQRHRQHDARHHASFAEIIGDSDALRAVLKIVRQVLPTAVPVLLQGESGTGKELVARAIHLQGPRSAGPFVAVNAAAIPGELLASALFGHRKGAFTGAIENRKGFFEAAAGGTIFLDEIGETSPEVQVRLLRVLQEWKITRVGETDEVPIDVRVIAASNRDLQAQVQSGAFRRDLFYRLNVVAIEIPPLRARQADIEPLAIYLLGLHQERIGKTIRSITPEALEKLRGYPWPGNVRELENVIQRAIILTEGDVITPDVLLLQNPSRDDSWSTIAKLPFRKAKAAFEERYFTDLLERAHGNKTRAAELAEIDRTVLHTHLKRIGRPR